MAELSAYPIWVYQQQIHLYWMKAYPVMQNKCTGGSSGHFSFGRICWLQKDSSCCLYPHVIFHMKEISSALYVDESVV